MKWSIYSIYILCILALSGVALGADQMMNKTVNAVSSANQSETYIFIQEGAGGSFVNDSSGNYTLTMTDVVPYTVFFADRPARGVGFAPMDRFLKGFSFGASNPPNAALILPEENETSDMVIVELTNPQYNNITRTLTYKARQLKEYSFDSGWFQDQLSKVDASIPERFGRVILVIDDCTCWRVTSGCESQCRNGCWKWKLFPPGCYPCGGCCDKSQCSGHVLVPEKPGLKAGGKK